VPRLDLEFGVPQLSQNLVIGAGGAFRAFRAVVARLGDLLRVRRLRLEQDGDWWELRGLCLREVRSVILRGSREETPVPVAPSGQQRAVRRGSITCWRRFGLGPDRGAHAERFVGSGRRECLNHFFTFTERAGTCSASSSSTT
jgi:hypothetical protein